MADQLAFNEGKDAVLGGGLTTSVKFCLSTKKVGTQAGGEHQVGDTFAGGFGKITGTGYADVTVNPRPASANGVVVFATVSWDVGAATDWQAARSLVMVDSNNKIIAAWNLVAGGASQSLAVANTQVDYTPTFFLQNVGGG